MTSALRGVVRFILALVTCVVPWLAHAQCVPGIFPPAQVSPAPTATSVSEYYDAASGRYYSAWSYRVPYVCDDIAIIQPSPTGTLPTGLGWTVPIYPSGCVPTTSILCAGPKALCAFVAQGQLAPASLFLTINLAECAALRAPGSGWTDISPPPGYDPRNPGLGAYEIDPSTGACPASLVPVYRFVNHRWTEGLGNHRYVADPAVLADMRQRTDWTEEGIAFCAVSNDRSALDAKSQFFVDSPVTFNANSMCFGSSSCIVASAMPAPHDSHINSAYFGVNEIPDVGGLTGSESHNMLVWVPAGVPIANVASHSFFQGANTTGLFVTSADRAFGNVSSLSTVNPVASTGVFSQPFGRGYDADMDLVLRYRLFLKRTRAAGIGNAAYVQALVTFVDHASGVKLELSPGGIGTVSSPAFATRDAATGNVLVYLPLGPQMAAGRSLGLPSLQVDANFDAEHPWGHGGDFEYRIDRGEFTAVLQLARQENGALSADPANYGVESFGLKGEVVGTSDIGFNVESMKLSVERP
jgi:hypothetical protein